MHECTTAFFNQVSLNDDRPRGQRSGRVYRNSKTNTTFPVFVVSQSPHDIKKSKKIYKKRTWHNGVYGIRLIHHVGRFLGVPFCFDRWHNAMYLLLYWFISFEYFHPSSVCVLVALHMGTSRLHTHIPFNAVNGRQFFFFFQIFRKTVENLERKKNSWIYRLDGVRYRLFSIKADTYYAICTDRFSNRTKLLKTRWNRHEVYRKTTIPLFCRA